MLKTPPFLLAAALLFWGWQVGLLVPGVVLALAIEGSRYAPARWDLADEDYNRIWTLSGVLLLGAIAYALFARDGAGAVSSFLQADSFAARSRSISMASQTMLILVGWLPLIFTPMLAAQAYGRRPAIQLSTFSLYWRWRMRALARSGAANSPARREPEIHVAYPFFALCLLAASTGNVRNGTFYAGAAVLLGWALIPHRSARFTRSVWILCIAAAMGLGFLAHSGLTRLEKWIDQLHTSIVSNFANRDVDPNESRTAIGEIGSLKLSGKIVLRVAASPTGQTPNLLRKSSYNRFESPRWFGIHKKFDSVFFESDEKTWELIPNSTPTARVRVWRYFPGGKGVLAVPNETVQLEEFSAFQLETNRLGTVRMVDGPRLASYDALSGGGKALDSPPDEDDLAIPESERAALARVIADLDLDPAGESVEKAAHSLQSFFQNHFEYTTYQSIPFNTDTNTTALASFLLDRRAGHCEYFGSATVLLLRALNVPARYAVGYSVQERRGEEFIVRQRHAHAWALYFDASKNRWIDLDTTPGSWSAIEGENAPWWEPLRDSLSAAWFHFSKWRWTGDKSIVRQGLLAVFAVSIAVLVMRLVLRKRTQRRNTTGGSNTGTAADWPGLDSEFFHIESQLATDGFERASGEPMASWLTRLENSTAKDERIQSLRELGHFHDRYRFDPAGLTAEERDGFRRRCMQWLEKGPSGSIVTPPLPPTRAPEGDRDGSAISR